MKEKHREKETDREKETETEKVVSIGKKAIKEEEESPTKSEMRLLNCQ